MQEDDLEKSKCLSIFSEEVWQKIFENVNDDEDLRNCENASIFFRDLLKPPWNGALLPQVLKILDKNGFLTSKDSKDILGWRLISREWRTAVKNLLRKRPYHSECKMPTRNVFDHSKENEADLAFPTYFRLYRFTAEELQFQIIPWMKTKYYFLSSPSPSRHLEIAESSIVEYFQFNSNIENDFELYSQEAEHFLHLVGHHFWHVTIEFQTGTLMERYKKLKRYLEHLPNLRSLYISDQSPRWTSEIENKFENTISKKSLALPTLGKVNLLSVCGTKGVLTKQLILAVPNAKIINFKRRLRGDFYPVINLLSNRQQLGIELVSVADIDYLADLRGLEILRVMGDTMSLGGLAFLNLFKALENCQDTLLELTLSLPFGPDKEDAWKLTKTPLNLTKLKKLDLAAGCYCSLDFLLGMQNLECLFLRFGQRSDPFDMKDDDKVERINFNACYKSNFMECNIWELIPSLKVVYLNPGHGNGSMKKHWRDGFSSDWADTHKMVFYKPDMYGNC